MNHTEIMPIVYRSVTGLGGSLVAVVMPWQQDLEMWIRLAGGFLGLIVALLSIVSLAIIIKNNLQKK